MLTHDAHHVTLVPKLKVTILILTANVDTSNNFYLMAESMTGSPYGIVL